MAQRRMISTKIVDTDAFIDMPVSARLLYYELNIRADDDGFVASPKKIQRSVGCSDDDFRVLIAKQFIIPFDTGICVIRHWKIHNYIQKDRYEPTQYIEEKSTLTEDNKIYELSVDTECIQNVSKMLPQVRLGKVRLGKVSIDNTSSSEPEVLPATEKTPYQQIFALYAENCNRMPQVRDQTDARKKAIKVLWNKHPDIEWFRELFERAGWSNFLCGENKNQWTANFDWVLKNHAKIMEGNYENRNKSKGSKQAVMEFMGDEVKHFDID